MIQKADAGGANNDFDFVIDTALDWETTRNNPKCMLKKMSICTTGSGTCTTPSVPTSDAIRLKANGGSTLVTFVESTDSTTVNPRLIIKRSTPTATEAMEFWLKGEIP